MSLLNWFLGRHEPAPPTAIAVTLECGGAWHAFPCKHLDGPPRGITVHAIAFSDGTVWDAFNGWRRGDQSRTMEYIERVC